MKIWVYLYALVFFLIMPGAVFCQDDDGDREKYSRQGVVSEVDSIGSSLVIFDGSEQLRFSVDPSAVIQRGDDNIMLDDLESNDTVTVGYYKSPQGILKAVSIIDNNIAADF